jgi:flavin-dependent dehydrogenase
MRIGVVGARLAGSYASYLLSCAGHEVFLLDHSLGREKACGGGVTGKALASMAWFRQHPLPHTEIRTMRMYTPDGRGADLTLRNPIHIFCRTTLDSALRDAACHAGTHLFDARAIDFTNSGAGWQIHTTQGMREVDLLLGADGATSTVRSAVAAKFKATDLSLALGYYLPGCRHPDTILTEFQERGFRGYAWSFPRIDHTSVGILQWLPFAKSSDLHRRVLSFISARYPDAGSDKIFYASCIPCLGRRRLVQQRVCGRNWALLGDAAGFADSITGEGIHFALRSAELLAEAISLGDVRHYERLWREEFGAHLRKAAEWRDRFYGGTFLFGPFIKRALQTLRRSATVRELTDALICGRSTYELLSRQIIMKSPRILLETVSDKLLS